MGKKRTTKENYLGKVQYVTTCGEPAQVGSRKACGEKFPGGDRKSDAVKAWERHERSQHKPQRDQAAREAREAERAARKARKDQKKSFENENKRRAREVAKDIARGRIKPPRGEWTNADIARLKSEYGQAAAEAAKRLQETPVGQVKKFSGLHTKGIPNVKDGQNINGAVYDKNGKRVPPDVIAKYAQGWGE